MTTHTEHKGESMTDIGRLKELSLFDAIQHGDDEHRAWLKAAITAHFAGEPVPPPSGSGRKDAEIETLQAENERLKAALKPVAEHVSALWHCYDDHPVIVSNFIEGSDLVICDVDDLRRAASALAAYDQGKVTICD